jgi:FAD/FMN-containing dehydrogenase
MAVAGAAATGAPGPDAVVAPASDRGAAGGVREAGRQGRSVGLYRPPRAGGWRLDLRRLDRIAEIDRVNLVATVEAGVTLGALRVALQAQGLRFVPADDVFHDQRTVGPRDHVYHRRAWCL